MNNRVRRLVQVTRVRVSATRVAPPDLHDELTAQREFQQLVVGDRLETRLVARRAVVPAEPDKPLVVDVDPVFALGPLVAVPGPSPGIEEITVAVEPQYVRRGHLGIVCGKRPRTVQEPCVVLRVDGDARDLAKPPLPWQLRPIPIHAEGRHAPFLRGLRLSCRFCLRGLLASNTSQAG